MQKHLFGWVYPRRARLFVIYLVSLAVTISVAFGLREASLALTTHIILPKQKIAAVSFLSENEEQLRDLMQSAGSAEEVQDRIKAEDALILVQAMQGKRPVVHTMIDAGMMRRKAENLNLAKQGVKLVFSRSKGGLAQDQPVSPWVRWQPVFVVEMNDGKVSQVESLDRGLFVGNPAMPVF